MCAACCGTYAESAARRGTAAALAATGGGGGGSEEGCDKCSTTTVVVGRDAHVISCIWAAYSQETELRGEARLLIETLCSTPRGYSASSSLIRCDDARVVLGAGPLALVVFEQAGRRLVLDALAAARREVASIVRTLGLLGAVGSALVLVVRGMMVRINDWRQCEAEHTFSKMHHAKQSSIVSFEHED